MMRFQLFTLFSMLVCSECIYWEPVFVGYQENGESIYNRWVNPVAGGCNNDACGRCTIGNGCIADGENLAVLPPLGRHLKSRIVDCWNTEVKIKEVRVEILNKSTKEVLGYMEFNAENSDKLTWFSKDRLLKSSWNDMFSDGRYNYFSIAGHIKRRFFVNQNYDGCPLDLGWFGIMDGNTHPCSMDNHAKYPVFLFAPGNHKTQWDLGAYKKADIFAVYIKRE